MKFYKMKEKYSKRSVTIQVIKIRKKKKMKKTRRRSNNKTLIFYERLENNKSLKTKHL